MTLLLQHERGDVIVIVSGKTMRVITMAKHCVGNNHDEISLLISLVLVIFPLIFMDIRTISIPILKSPLLTVPTESPRLMSLNLFTIRRLHLLCVLLL